MSADEDTELRDLIMQTLENSGVVGKIKAELRASVFLALEEEGSFRDKIPLVNNKLCEFIATADGKRTVSLVREFLHFFNMNFTMSVFDPEVSDSNLLSREELCNEFSVTDIDSNSPVILELIKCRNINASDSKKICSQPFLKNTDESDRRTNDVHSSTQLVKNSFGNSVKNSDLKSKNSIHDPFYDEPLSTSQQSVFAINHDDNQLKNKGKGEENSFNNQLEDKDENLYYTHLKAKDDKENDLFLDQLKFKNDESLFSNDIKPRERKDITSFSMKADTITERSLSSLRDLPALNVGSRNIPDKNQKLLLSGSGFVYDGSGDKCDGIEHSTKLSQKSAENIPNLGKYDADSQDNSELSIEEEIDDDASEGIDDLLSSISVGDDTTNDITISQISNAGGYDHVEPVLSK